MTKKASVEATLNGKKIDINRLAKSIERPYEIMGAILKDGYCNYDVKVLQGQMTGETSNVKGPLIVHDDLRDTFTRMAVHLAIIDMAFEHSNINVESLEAVRSHNLTYDYNVTGIKIKASDENIQVSIIGDKYLNTCTGRMSCVTPFILLDAGTSYKWYNELLEDVESLREQVDEYKHGKGTQPEAVTKKIKKNKNQTKLTDTDQVVQQEFGETVKM